MRSFTFFGGLLLLGLLVGLVAVMRGADISDRQAYAAEPLLNEDFDSYGPGADPTGWLDQDSSLASGDFFETSTVGSATAFGTELPTISLFSHYNAASALGWQNYEYRGRLYFSDDAGGVGLTLYSHYPAGEDRFYRIIRYSGESAFRLAPRGTNISDGILRAEVGFEEDVWFAFRVQVETTATRVNIRAKVWPEGSPEPDAWQIDAYDAYSTRITAGTVGIWTMTAGFKGIDDIQVLPLGAPGDPTPSPTPTPTFPPGSSPTPTLTPTPTPPPTPTSASPSPVSLTRYPYVQEQTSSSVVVAWRTDVPGDSVVEYGVTPAYGSQVVDPSSVTRHAVTLTGLTPNTTYYYSVASLGTALAAGSFHTSRDASDPNFSFVALGDSGCGCAAQVQLADRIQTLNPDLVIHTGDVNQISPLDYDQVFFDVYRDLAKSKPFFLTRGSWDIPSIYLDNFYLPHNNPAGSELYYSFDYGNAHFTSLDTTIDYSPGSAQYNWLVNDLATTDKFWKFVFTHRPPYSTGNQGSDLGVRAVLSPLFEQYEVDIVFTGNDHDYERTTPIREFHPEKRGVTYIVTGGGGHSLFPMQGPASWTAYREVTFHAVRVQVDGKVLTLEAVKADGSVFDTYTINRLTTKQFLINEDFESYAPGDSPVNWVDQDASLAEGDLFQVTVLGGTSALGTASQAFNLYSHYSGAGALEWQNYQFTGRMYFSDGSGGVGATFHSRYPAGEDKFYRLFRYPNTSVFRLDAHGTNISDGILSVDVPTQVNTWHRFKVRVETTDSRVNLRAKIWEEGTAEPLAWQIDAYDASGTRLTAGTVGVWTASTGSKGFDDLQVQDLTVALTRHPYIQEQTANSVVIAWKTDVASDSVIEYGPTPALGLAVGDAGLVTQHAVTLAGLSPDTTYYYRVLSNGVDLTAGDAFRTNPDASTAGFSFVVLGDSGCQCLNQYQVADRIKALNPDLALHTGDIHQTLPLDYDLSFFSPYQDLIRSIPLFVTRGEWDSDLGDYLVNFYLPHNNPAGSELYYSFDYGNAHFISLDTTIDYSPGSAQYNWLVNDLATTDKFWKFVFTHRPPYSTGNQGSDLDVRAVLSPLFEQYEVDIVFTGNDHDYERTVPIKDFYPSNRGVVYIVNGGGGFPTFPMQAPASWTAYREETLHVAAVEVAGGQLTLEAVKPDGTVFDSHTIDRSGEVTPVPTPTPEATSTPTPTPTPTPSPTPVPTGALLANDFEAYADGEDPLNWVDQDNNLNFGDYFQAMTVGTDTALATDNQSFYLYSHYDVPEALTWQNYEYSGRMYFSHNRGGVGLTFHSRFSSGEDKFYRLIRYGGQNLIRLAPHGTNMSGGILSAQINAIEDTWYNFRIQVETTGSRVNIRGKVWETGAPEPAEWQIDAYDAYSTRITSGTVGVWTMWKGTKAFDDLVVVPLD